MAYTSHGHQIPGTPVTKPALTSMARCGGLGRCRKCEEDALLYTEKNPVIPEPEWKIGTNEDFQEKAKRLVRGHIDGKFHKGSDYLPVYETYIVWFSKTLQNWKALVSTTMPDGMYYEVTYNGDKRETYIDVYTKVENVVVKD